MKSKIEKMVLAHYLDSGDFNGLNLYHIQSELEADFDELTPILIDLIQNDRISIIDDKTDFNPNIIRLGFESKEVQIQKIRDASARQICLYPHKNVLCNEVDLSKFDSKPFGKMLAQGEAQLSHINFDLSVLEYYRNDPRYDYENDDIRGHIYFNDDSLAEHDKVLLQTYGFSYDDDMNRSVAVFLRYLADLSEEHQQIWCSKKLEGKRLLHPDYYRNTVIGDWGEKIPVCKALVLELYIINQMSKAMGRDSLFRTDYGIYGESAPQNFHFLIRPTLDEFNNFILLLDKMVSDNLNINFFKNDIDLENEEERSDGKIVVRPKGTLQLLDEWIRSQVRMPSPEDWADWDNTIGAFKKVRKLRQKPAHAINENVFDQKYFKDQREIIINTYKGIRFIRMLFSNHPEVQRANIDISKQLFEGKIWNF